MRVLNREAFRRVLAPRGIVLALAVLVILGSLAMNVFLFLEVETMKVTAASTDAELASTQSEIVDLRADLGSSGRRVHSVVAELDNLYYSVSALEQTVGSPYDLDSLTSNVADLEFELDRMARQVASLDRCLDQLTWSLRFDSYFISC